MYQIQKKYILVLCSTKYALFQSVYTNLIKIMEKKGATNFGCVED